MLESEGERSVPVAPNAAGWVRPQPAYILSRTNSPIGKRHTPIRKVLAKGTPCIELGKSDAAESLFFFCRLTSQKTPLTSPIIRNFSPSFPNHLIVDLKSKSNSEYDDRKLLVTIWRLWDCTNLLHYALHKTGHTSA